MKGVLSILAGGLLFGWGLALCGLAKQEVVLSFLRLEDLGLAVTMLSAYVVTMPAYLIVPRFRKTPLLDRSFTRMPSRIPRANVLGAVIFGVGWGVSGLCPGSAVASLGLLNTPILAGIFGMLVGAYLHGHFAHGHFAASQAGKLARTRQES